MHRDLNVKNVLLHFPSLELSESQLEKPEYFQKLAKKRQKLLLSDLTSIQFEVLIADFGISFRQDNGRKADTICGTAQSIAPEVLHSDIDQRVDVWGVGVIYYMLLTNSNLFATPIQLKLGVWQISTEIDFSIEALRFMNEILTWDQNHRPFADKLVNHDYFR